MTLPTRQDINVHDSLDERSACEHFLGKSLEEAEELRLVAEHLAAACGYIIEHYDRFNLTPDVYGDIRPRYRALREAFLQQIESERQ